MKREAAVEKYSVIDLLVMTGYVSTANEAIRQKAASLRDIRAVQQHPNTPTHQHPNTPANTPSPHPPHSHLSHTPSLTPAPLTHPKLSSFPKIAIHTKRFATGRKTVAAPTLEAKMASILLVDDDDQLRTSFQKLLELEGHNVRVAANGEAALALVRSALPDAVIMDVRMPGMDGIATLRKMREFDSRLPVIIMTAYSTTESAIEATKLGAFDYILKPFDIPDILSLLEKALDVGRMAREQVLLSHGEEDAHDAEALVGASKAMHELYKAIGRVAPTEALVLLRGESGTGKELVARAVYQHSARNNRPFLVVNCVAIPDTLLESELFGYEKGAFTGAHARRIGKIEQASGGTVFLDEIGDIPLRVQAKLLRLLQEKQIERLGGRETLDIDVRIIAATNKELEQAVKEGRFREDLYYRLNVVSLHLPPLRDRQEDIPLLVRHFVRKLCRAMECPAPEVSPEALELFSQRRWPGNVRELINFLQKMLIFHQGGTIAKEDAATALTSYDAGQITRERPAADHTKTEGVKGSPEAFLRGYAREALALEYGGKTFDAIMDEMGAAIIQEALTLCAGNRSRTARLLGLSRPTLLAKIEKYGL